MSGFKNFAVVGAGDIGRPIIEELLSYKAQGKIDQVVVLTRQTSISPDLTSKGATPRTISYTTPSTLVAALSAVDVLISCVPVTTSADNQLLLIDAAKEAGVKLFVPSEFGLSTHDKTTGVWGVKNTVRNYLVQKKLPYTQYFTGAFIGWFLIDHPEYGVFDWKNGKVVIKGSGSTPVTWTKEVDIARYVVWTLVNLEADKLNNAAFGVEGDRKTVREIVEEFQARTGRTLEVKHESRAEVEKRVEESRARGEASAIMINVLYLALDKEGVVGPKEEMNKWWPEFNPAGAVDTIIERAL